MTATPCALCARWRPYWTVVAHVTPMSAKRLSSAMAKNTSWLAPPPGPRTVVTTAKSRPSDTRTSLAHLDDGDPLPGRAFERGTDTMGRAPTKGQGEDAESPAIRARPGYAEVARGSWRPRSRRAGRSDGDSSGGADLLQRRCVEDVISAIMVTTGDLCGLAVPAISRRLRRGLLLGLARTSGVRCSPSEQVDLSLRPSPRRKGTPRHVPAVVRRSDRY